ncbi:Nucleoid occlusion protein [subsurface metagenome]
MGKREKKASLVSIAIGDLVEPKERIRLEIDQVDIFELSESIREVGLLQPIVVCKDGDKFEIVYGHRRYLAIRKLGWDSVQCIVREFDGVSKAFARASENLNRADLTPMEEAAVYTDLLKEHGLSIKQVGDKMGKAASFIKDRVDLMKMPEVVQQEIHRGKISPAGAKLLCKIKDQKELFRYLEAAVEDGATNKTIKLWVEDWKDRIKYMEIMGVQGSPPEGNGLVEKSYAACQICERPVEYSEVKHIHTCKECLDKIIKAVGKEGP